MILFIYFWFFLGGVGGCHFKLKNGDKCEVFDKTIKHYLWDC